MSQGEEISVTLRAINELLTDLDIRFHITGGLAAAYYGEPRFTQDIDVVVDPKGLVDKLDQFLTLARREFVVSESAVRTALQEGSTFQLLHEKTLFKIDLYPRESVGGELERSEHHELFSGINVPVVSAVDAVLSKLLWVAKGSHRSRRDIRAMIQFITDQQYGELRKMVSSLELEELFNDILTEIEPES